MKLKFLATIAAMAAMVLSTSCDKKTSSSKDDDNDDKKTEQRDKRDGNYQAASDVDEYCDALNDLTQRVVDAESIEEIQAIQQQAQDLAAQYRSSDAPLSNRDRENLAEAIGYITGASASKAAAFYGEDIESDELQQMLEIFADKAQEIIDNSETLGEALRGLRNINMN